MLAGAVVGFFLGALGSPIQTIQIAAGIAGGVLGLLVSYFTFRWRIKCLLEKTGGSVRGF